MAALQANRVASQGVIVNIESELAYWRQCFEQKSFHLSGQRFEAYVPTFKFGYDAYLQHYRDPLEILLPALKARYEHSLPSTQRLDWGRGQSIIKETWRRMLAA